MWAATSEDEHAVSGVAEVGVTDSVCSNEVALHEIAGCRPVGETAELNAILSVPDNDVARAQVGTADRVTARAAVD